ncbi:unnamed protein product [Microthlaspi erraticum]|uniref:DUF577 domain-containing protein n=1 Tax=Microthlaspi erraticum TaxID=1685480 RepID=A0A6D2KTU5_9BRAS|nr:unnamed protein product [Microthlaspi erraticum]
MARTPDLWPKAMDLLRKKSLSEVAEALFPLLMDQETTTQYRSSLALYKYCVDTAPDALTLKLLSVYPSSFCPIFRFQWIHLLSGTITYLRNHNFRFSPTFLPRIKPQLIACVNLKESKDSETKILARIVSFVAENVAASDGEWIELSDCIIDLAKKEPRKACLVVLDLPLSYGRFINRFARLILEMAKVLLNPQLVESKDWSLVLQTAIKIGVLQSDSRNAVETIVVDTAENLAKNGITRELLLKGIEDLKLFLARDGIFNRYSKEQLVYVGWLVFQISACCHQSIEQSKRVSGEVLRVMKKPKKHHREHGGEGFESDWCEYLTEFPTEDLLRVFASTNLGERCRELAIRRLNGLLSDHASKKERIEIRVMRLLQRDLIERLKEEGLAEHLFIVLGEVVVHVANELASSQDDKWFDLWHYIATECKTEFKKAVYIFQCLTMMVDADKDFMVPTIESLIPEISSRLKPPGDLLVVVDERCWSAAFVGAFCVVVHLVEIRDRVETVKEVLFSMVGSVRELVERRMEVEFVMRAFKDVESIVKKQMSWYSTGEYRVVKGLLWRLGEIEGMEMESKDVLFRMEMSLERGVFDALKGIPKSELDWLSKPEA